MPKKKKAPHLTEGPTCSCLLICDDVVISTALDKHVLQGVIGMIAVSTLPGLAGGFVAYLRVSNVYDAKTIKVRLENAATEEILWELDAQLVSKKDPLEVHTLVAKIHPFEVKESGRYILSALYNDVPMAQTPVLVIGPP